MAEQFWLGDALEKSGVRCVAVTPRAASQTDLLLPSTARDMTRRGPRADVIEFADCGHAPALMDKQQVGAVINWLGATASLPA